MTLINRLYRGHGRMVEMVTVKSTGDKPTKLYTYMIDEEEQVKIEQIQISIISFRSLFCLTRLSCFNHFLFATHDKYPYFACLHL